MESNMAEKPGIKPQDHKTKEEKPNVENVEIDLPDGVDDDDEPKFRKVKAKRVTVREVTVDVPDEAMDDFEFLDDLRAVQDENDPSRMPSLLRRLVGDQYKAVMNALRNDKGRVTVEAGSEYLRDLFGALNPNS